MVQHMSLLYLVPLFALLSHPFDWVAAVLGKARTAALVRATKPLHAVAAPAPALGCYVAVLWLAHFSGLYQRSLENAWVHAGEHALFLAAGTLFWIPVLAPHPLRPLSFPVRLVYLIVALPQGALLGATLASSREPLYPHYVAELTRAAAIADQQAAGAVMWIAGGIIVFVALLATLGLWAAREGDGVPVVVPQEDPT